MLTEEVLERLGSMIDSASDAGDPTRMEQASAECEALLKGDLTPEQRATLHYFLANVWHAKRLLNRSGTQAEEWEQPDLEAEILHLRRALRFAREGEVPDYRVCQILTNLANALSHVGRPAEAIAYWDRALEIIPSFPMARGNRGHGLKHYARLLWDRGHQAVLLREAHRDLNAALRFPLHPAAAQSFKSSAADIEAWLTTEFLEHGADLEEFSLGDSAEEIEYRRWCLQQRLFLNELNDLGPYPIAAADVLGLPSMIVPVDEGPHYIGFFNQIKQEFVSARFLLYEGLTASEPHFSDREVSLMNTLDYPCYSLAVEKVKSAFRTAYSIFDKIAFFLNHYLSLGLPDRKVSFKTIWYEKQERSHGVSPRIEGLGNNVLRGLFWLSKDLSERRPGFAEAIEPGAKDIEELRQHAEHRYLKLHLYASAIRRPDDYLAAGLVDTLARSVTRSEFEEKAVWIFRMARAALIYLGAAVSLEEGRRAGERGSDGLVMPMALDTWEDRWKY